MPSSTRIGATEILCREECESAIRCLGKQLEETCLTRGLGKGCGWGGARVASPDLFDGPGTLNSSVGTWVDLPNPNARPQTFPQQAGGSTSTFCKEPLREPPPGRAQIVCLLLLIPCWHVVAVARALLGGVVHRHALVETALFARACLAMPREGHAEYLLQGLLLETGKELARLVMGMEARVQCRWAPSVVSEKGSTKEDALQNATDGVVKRRASSSDAPLAHPLCRARSSPMDPPHEGTPRANSVAPPKADCADSCRRRWYVAFLHGARGSWNNATTTAVMLGVSGACASLGI